MATIKLAQEINVSWQTVRTVTSAERTIIQLSVDLRWYGIEHPSANEWANGIEALTDAICEVTGQTRQELLQRLDAPTERSFKRQEREAQKVAARLGLS